MLVQDVVQGVKLSLSHQFRSLFRCTLFMIKNLVKGNTNLVGKCCFLVHDEDGFGLCKLISFIMIMFNIILAFYYLQINSMHCYFIVFYIGHVTDRMKCCRP